LPRGVFSSVLPHPRGLHGHLSSDVTEPFRPYAVRKIMRAPVNLECAAPTDDAGGSTAPVRAFFALVPDEPVRAALVDLARDVARRSRGRAVTGEHVHLTLAFLGDVPASGVPALQAIGASIPHVGAVLEFDTLGAWRASGVAWTGPSVIPPELLALHATLGTALAGAGIVLESRAFRPHVTLARRCVQPLPRTRTTPIRWRVDRLRLVGSELLSQGPVYRDLASWPLTIAA
jgi:2'-5' RNA ligase